MKKVLSIIIAIVMLTVIMPINTFAANLETDKYISGITYEDASEDCYGGYRVTRASDPTGIYAATYGYINDNDSVWYYFVRHYVYVDKYDAYFADENFGEYGELNILASDFESSEYSFIGNTSIEPAEVHYYENASAVNGNSYYVVQRVKRASDPNGVYGATEGTITTNNVTVSGKNINRFVYAPGTTKYIKDDTFADLWITDTDFATSEYSFMNEEVFHKEELNWTGSLMSGQFGNYVDGSGTHYAVDNAHNVYKIDGGTVTVGESSYYALTKISYVNFENLTPAVVDKDTCNHYYVGTYSKKPTCTAKGTVKYECKYCHDVYTADAAALGHNYKSVTVVKPTCTAKGYTQYTCTRCKTSYKTKYQNALGHSAVTDKAVAPTFTKTGLTKGSHCKRCGKIITKQKRIAALGGVKFGTLTVGKNKFTLNWVPIKSVQGYQIQYGTSKTYKGVKKITIKDGKAKSRTIKGLKSNKTYYVRIRAYKKINGKMQYSAWSKSKVKT